MWVVGSVVALVEEVVMVENEGAVVDEARIPGTHPTSTVIIFNCKGASGYLKIIPFLH